MDKRGISHIEVMLSFLIFAGSVIFALYFFNPGQTTRFVDSSLSYTIREVSQELEVDVTTITVKIDPASVSLGLRGRPLEVVIGEEINENKHVRVENSEGTMVPSQRQMDSNNTDNQERVRFLLADDAYNQAGRDEGFASIQFSEDFVPYNGPADFSNPVLSSEVGYTLSTSNHESVISEARAWSLKSRYLSDYEGLKTEFNLPKRLQFEFALIIDETQKIEAKKDHPFGAEVIPHIARTKILRQTGEKIFGDFIVRIW